VCTLVNTARKRQNKANSSSTTANSGDAMDVVQAVEEVLPMPRQQPRRTSRGTASYVDMCAEAGVSTEEEHSGSDNGNNSGDSDQDVSMAE
jgi:hypothetical protein